MRCRLCEETFNTRWTYNEHLRSVHPHPATLSCSLCTKMFHTRSTLRQHIIRHRERTFLCPHCTRSYHTQSDLDTHLRIHLHEQPFPCPICPHWANSRSELTAHHESHHTERGIQQHKHAEHRVEKALIARGYTLFISSDGTLPPPRAFTREHIINFECIETPVSKGEHRAFIDFVIALPNGGLCFLEVDEHQHKHGYMSDKSCDMKRMSRVEESRTLEYLQHNDSLTNMPRTMWLRYNPHSYTIDNKKQRPTFKANEQRLCEYLDNVVIGAECKNAHTCIRYLNYDTDDGVPLCITHPGYHPAFRKLAAVIPSTITQTPASS